MKQIQSSLTSQSPRILAIYKSYLEKNPEECQVLVQISKRLGHTIGVPISGLNKILILSLLSIKMISFDNSEMLFFYQ